MHNNMLERKYISLAEAAERLGLHKVTLERAVDDGKLTAVKDIFKYTATTEEWINAWLLKNTVNLPAEQGEE